jgi:hypothetical protein
MGAPPPRAHSSAATASEEGAGTAAKVSFKEAMAQLAAFPEVRMCGGGHVRERGPCVVVEFCWGVVGVLVNPSTKHFLSTYDK